LNAFRLRSCNLPTFRARTDELLDIEWIAKVIYGMYATISFAIFILTVIFRSPLWILLSWTIKTLSSLAGDDSIWLILYYVFLIFFIPLAHFCVEAYAPEILRKLLYRILVQPKMERIYRENHEEIREASRNGAHESFWSRLKEGYLLTLHRLKEMFTPNHTKRGYIMLPSDIDEASDALSLHDVPSIEE
jgi:hypothetical protein